MTSNSQLWVKVTSRWGVLGLLFLLGAGLYVPALSHGFLNLDDLDYVRLNPHVSRGLSPKNVAWAWTTFAEANWHPITWMSLQLDGSFSGENPRGYHLTNAVLHGLNCSLIAWVLWRMTGHWGNSVAVAALFAVHPQHVESVAWITERKDLLSQLFGFLAVWGYYESVVHGRKRAWIGSLVCYAASLMSKPMWVTLPCLLMLLDFWPLCRIAGVSPTNTNQPASSRSWKFLFWEKLPYWGLSAAMCIITILAQQSGHAVRDTTEFPIGERIANSLIVYWLYLGQTFWPVELAIYYPQPVLSPPVWQAIVSAMAIVVLICLAWRFRKHSPAALVGWLWFLGTLVPVIGILQVGNQRYADRYMYLPHVGMFIALVWLGNSLLQSGLIGQRMKVIALTGLIAGWGVLTERYLWYWHDSIRVLERTLAVTENNPYTHYVLGLAYFIEMRNEEALEEMDKALAIPSRNNRLPAMFHHKKGVIYNDMKRFEESEAEYRLAAKLNPLETNARWQLVEICRKRQDLVEARQWLVQIVNVSPPDAQTFLELGELCLQMGDAVSAKGYFLEAEHIDPNIHNRIPYEFRIPSGESKR